MGRATTLRVSSAARRLCERCAAAACAMRGKASRAPPKHATVALMAHPRRFALTVPALSALALAASLSVSCKDKPADTTATDAAPRTMGDAAVALPAASTPMPATSADGGGGPDDREAHRGDHGGPSVMLFQ